MRIQISVLGETQLNRDLLRYVEVSGNLMPALEQVHQYLINIEKRQFGSEGRQSGNPWEKLKQSTLDEKQRGGFDMRILHRTLDLRKSLTEETDPAHVKYITPTMMVFGTTLEYPIYHQRPIGSVFPQRRAIDLTEGQKVTMVKMIQKYLNAAGRRKV